MKIVEKVKAQARINEPQLFFNKPASSLVPLEVTHFQAAVLPDGSVRLFFSTDGFRLCRTKIGIRFSCTALLRELRLAGFYLYKFDIVKEQDGLLLKPR